MPGATATPGGVHAGRVRDSKRKKEVPQEEQLQPVVWKTGLAQAREAAERVASAAREVGGRRQLGVSTFSQHEPHAGKAAGCPELHLPYPYLPFTYSTLLHLLHSPHPHLTSTLP